MCYLEQLFKLKTLCDKHNFGTHVFVKYTFSVPKDPCDIIEDNTIDCVRSTNYTIIYLVVRKNRSSSRNIEVV